MNGCTDKSRRYALFATDLFYPTLAGCASSALCFFIPRGHFFSAFRFGGLLTCVLLLAIVFARSW